MRRRATALAFASTLAIAVPAAGGGHAQALRVHAPRAGGDSQISSNWAGYAVSGTGASGEQVAFTDVTGRWVQPTPDCSSGNEAYSAFWVGLGGFAADSRALEQVGTEVDCAGGRAVSTAWYEIVPSPAVPLRMKILPGDRMVAAVLAKGTQVVLQITDATRHVRVTKTVEVPAPDLTSAEWIAEAPSACGSRGGCRTLPLANFGSVAFTQAAATGDDHAGTITDPAWQATPIELAERGGVDQLLLRPAGPTSGAAPGALSADGRSFSVAWHPAR